MVSICIGIHMYKGEISMMKKLMSNEDVAQVVQIGKLFIGGVVLAGMAWVVWAFKFWLIVGFLSIGVLHTLVWYTLGKDLFYIKKKYLSGRE